MIRLLIMIIIGLISVSSSAHAESRMHTEEMSEPERPIADSDIKDAFLAALSSRPCGNGIVNAYAHAVRLCCHGLCPNCPFVALVKMFRLFANGRMTCAASRMLHMR